MFSWPRLPAPRACLLLSTFNPAQGPGGRDSCPAISLPFPSVCWHRTGWDCPRGEKGWHGELGRLGAANSLVPFFLGAAGGRNAARSACSWKAGAKNNCNQCRSWRGTTKLTQTSSLDTEMWKYDSSNHNWHATDRSQPVAEQALGEQEHGPKIKLTSSPSFLEKYGSSGHHGTGRAGVSSSLLGGLLGL